MNDVELVFEDKNKNLVVIMPKALHQLYNYRQLEAFSCEAGGILIGERRGQHIVIWDISVPGTGDKQSRFSFERLGKHHQKKINDAHHYSSGRMQYLGEWHTHPEDHPQPSIIDRNTWKIHLQAHQPMIVLIIGHKTIWAAKKVEHNISTIKAIKY